MPLLLVIVDRSPLQSFTGDDLVSYGLLVLDVEAEPWSLGSLVDTKTRLLGGVVAEI